MDTSIFELHESNVCRYGKSFPTVFAKAKGATIWNEKGKIYIDFLTGSGALNYGHNNEEIIGPAIRYLSEDNIQLSLDMYTAAKREFIKTFVDVILRPRQMRYKIQFTGPTGTNANEAALALARKVTGRSTVLAFSNSFHGMSLGSLAVSGSASTQRVGGVARHDVVRVPYDRFPNSGFDSASYISAMLSEAGSGYDLPAAIILETIQAEGGMHAASANWMQAIQEICTKHNILLILDDIQAGSGRTGKFFSFEEFGIKPDIISLSKSLSGSGLPLAVVLIRPEIDAWKSGEHSGTFRGSNVSFVTATAACHLWSQSRFLSVVDSNRTKIQEYLDGVVDECGDLILKKRGRGLMVGLLCKTPEIARRVHDLAFSNGLLIEISGAKRDVIKVMPPITISMDEMERGLEILSDALKEQCHG